MAVVLAALSVVFALIFWWYLNFLHYNRYLKKYPGPFPWPVIGNSHNFGDGSDLIPNIQKLIDNHGPLFKLMLGHLPRLVIAEPKFAGFLFSSNIILEKSYEYSFFHPWLGRGLLTSSGKRWKTHRKLITPAFHFQILKNFVEVFKSQSDILVKKLHKEVGQKPVDIMPYISLCSLDIICESTMGTSVNAQNDSESEYVHSIKEICRIITERTLSPTKMWDVLFMFSADYQKHKKALEVLHGFANSVIRNRRKKLIDEGTTNRILNPECLNPESRQKLAFLDLLLQSTVNGELLSDETIREEVDTFMFEGHDTISSAISFTLYCLSRHQTVQEGVVEELRRIFSDNESRELTYDDLQKMKYLEMVIKESLRLYPPVPLYGRLLKEDVEFDGGILPKGLTLTVFTYGLHRNPDCFLNPEEFDPERFSPDNIHSNLPYAYVPFSAGPRNCIGQRFANMEMKFIISEILRNFQLLPVADHKLTLSTEVILKPANGLPICIEKRHF